MNPTNFTEILADKSIEKEEEKKKRKIKRRYPINFNVPHCMLIMSKMKCSSAHTYPRVGTHWPQNQLPITTQATIMCDGSDGIGWQKVNSNMEHLHYIPSRN